MTAPPPPARGGGSAARQCGAPEIAALDVGGGAGGGGRRLLMIARDFLPANTSAALRALRFARHLGEYGWHTSVVRVRHRFHRSTSGRRLASDRARRLDALGAAPDSDKKGAS